jgi:hypothetical protein
MRTSKAHTGLRTGFVWHRRWRAYAAPRQRCVVWNRGGSRMRESRTYGSVRGALSNERPYRDERQEAGAISWWKSSPGKA